MTVAFLLAIKKITAGLLDGRLSFYFYFLLLNISKTNVSKAITNVQKRNSSSHVTYITVTSLLLIQRKVKKILNFPFKEESNRHRLAAPKGNMITN